jgi:PEP-CTERM motif
MNALKSLVSSSVLEAGAWQFLSVALAVAVMGFSGVAESAPLSPFNYGAVDIFDASGNDVIPSSEVSSASAPVFVESGTLPTAQGEARAGFGSNGFVLQASGPARGAAAASIWSDSFVVTGRTGSGVAALSAQIDGSLAGDADLSYALFVSPLPFDVQIIEAGYGTAPGFDFDPQVPNSERFLYTAIANGCGGQNGGGSAGCGHVPLENVQGPVNLTLTGSFSFTYGQTYYFASVFEGDVSANGGSEQFFNSADFGITVPAGATLTAISGTQYAAAVPEPETWILLLAGLGGIVAVFQRRMATSMVRQPS